MVANGDLNDNVESPPGVAVAILGGFRSLVADLWWVRAYGDWSRRDEVAMRQNLGWVGRVDPRPVGYWINGARMIGYDGTAWRHENRRNGMELAGTPPLAAALIHLEQAQRHHPRDVNLVFEEVMMRWRLGRDREGALAVLVRAESCSDVPYYVGRLRGELLVQLGRPEEALAWLVAYRLTMRGP
ncbi:MAG: hypothetical protein J6386_21350 [Candidatus Synoicihabitans palmerolidicus]|nr:hypothetical protein [Candidatus Synoicihabitans palmerolidicus]